jgi:hypothetical protein
MTPEYRAALYTLIENAVVAASPSDPLFEASVPRTSRAQVNDAKVIRVVSGPGRFNFGGETSNRAVQCLFTIQCWVMPTSGSGDHSEDDDDREAALDTAMEMAEAIFNALHNNQNLSGAVCLADADDYDAEFASHGGMLKAAAYLDGVINPGDVQG